MKIGVLTSSRADFGIYLPLLQKVNQDSFFQLEVIAFGTHLSEKFGYTVTEIEAWGFKSINKIETTPQSDTPVSISESVGNTVSKFADFWNNNDYDLVLCLGDRYEMFAAVSAGSPFNVKFAHIHAGETTLGAIDNAYRHAISLFSKYLFVSNKNYKDRASEIVKNTAQVFNVGALSIDNLKKIDFLSVEEFKNRFDIDLSAPTILSTFHPETVKYNQNEQFVIELISAFEELKNKYQIVVTLPNADTSSQIIREKLMTFGQINRNVHIVESFGMIGYLSCMKYCKFMLGNTSSGFVEASYFPKWVVNLGERQKGRIITENIIPTQIKKSDILDSINFIENKTDPNVGSVYGEGNTAERIVGILKEINE